MRTLAVDTLHCLYLGISRNLICFLFWRFVDNLIWIKQGTLEERLQSNCIVFTRNLMLFIAAGIERILLET